jgi:hypothetical protein
MTRFIGLFVRSSLLHLTVHCYVIEHMCPVTFLLQLLVAVSNRWHSSSSGFPNCPGLSSQRLNLSGYLTHSFLTCPVFDISAQTMQKTLLPLWLYYLLVANTCLFLEPWLLCSCLYCSHYLSRGVHAMLYIPVFCHCTIIFHPTVLLIPVCALRYLD